MLQRVRRFANKLHKDETGPNTVEWILLIIVALVLLVAIYMLVKWALGEFNTKAQKMKDEEKGL